MKREQIIETYRKVYIKSEADLPKVQGWYFIFYKPLPRQSCPMELEHFDLNNDERTDYWIDKIESYLQPIEQKDTVKKKTPKEPKIKICAGCGSFAHGNSGHDIT